ncbi:MAG: NmrA family NAD(P)-binding protein [Saprospiraceae bacterium]|nr:NmrA family NAD(P)-binding protein [Saprospiraceae bacterium]
MKKVILVAGATGNLGMRIVSYLSQKNAEIRVIVRSESEAQKIKMLETLGADIYITDHWNLSELTIACQGVSCVISALAGLREVIIDAQKVLLDAAIAANVPRFIPSDFSLDFTKFFYGENRNLDLRREFHEYLDKTSISSTSIMNGAFTDMLTDQMPLILIKQKLILYWGDADHKWGFTTIDNTAEYTANVAMDAVTPRYLRIAGDLISPREVKIVANEVFGPKFRLFRPGGKWLLGMLIKITRKLSPGKNELYPAWQGMQYMHNLIDERANIDKTDNDRYPEIQWKTVKDVLTDYQSKTL